jgi:hypothetical protein
LARRQPDRHRTNLCQGKHIPVILTAPPLERGDPYRERHHPPRNGIKSGAVAGTPCRRSSITWPISWTKIKSTKQAAKVQPKKSAYAATDTSMDSTSPRYFSLIRRAPNFARKAPIAASVPTMRSHTRRSVLFGLPFPAGRPTPLRAGGGTGTGVRSPGQGGVPLPFACPGHQSAPGCPCGPTGGAS